tara:strand:- start:11500 stop:12327 length:828 start_codon:yes stop_codon:yes gene_type:complete
MLETNIHIDNLADDNTNQVYFIDLKESNKEELFSLMDSYILDVCYAKYKTNPRIHIQRACKSIKKAIGATEKILKVESLTTKQQGTIAEFFIHIFLNKYNYLPHSSLFNLESEREIKKGFDGLYTKDNQVWLMESKSSISKISESHNDNITESYRDLCNKLAGNDPNENNPWFNAHSHAIKYSEDTELVNKLFELGLNHQDEEYEKIEDYNIIPSSTIFAISEFKHENNKSRVLRNIKNYFNNSDKCKQVNCICISNYFYEYFIEYINERSSDDN